MRYQMCDTKKLDGFYVQFARKLEDDDCSDAPDERDEGFWPSLDKDSCGYVGPCSEEAFAAYQEKAQARMDAWKRGDWNYVGVRAEARCVIVKNGTGIYVNLESPGVWGIESDAGGYLQEVYLQELATLKGMIAAMKNPVYEGLPAVDKVNGTE